MRYYYILYVIVLLLSLLAKRQKSRSKGLLGIITCLIFLFFGFRIGFTLDYDSYAMDFSGYGAGERHETESLYMIMTHLFSYRFALILQAALFSILLFICLKDYISKKYWWLALTVLFWNVDFLIGFFSGYRSSFVAMAILVAIIAKIRIPNNVAGIIISSVVIYISSLFHYSGLFMIPLVFIPNKPLGDKWMKLIMGLTIVGVALFLFFANTINTYVSLFAQTYSDGYMTYYLEGDSVDNFHFSPSNIIALAAKLYMLFYTYSWMRKPSAGYGNAFIVMTAIFFFLLLAPAIGLISRVYYYMLFPAIIGITTMMQNERNNNKKIIFLGCLVIYLFLKFRIFVIADYSAAMQQYSNILFM